MGIIELPVSIEEGVRTLGTFDPVNLLIHLKGSSTSDPDLRKGLYPVKAHELLHYFQMTGTSNGVRLFGFWTDLLEVKLNVIGQAAKSNEGKLEIPLLYFRPKNMSEYQKYIRLLGMYLNLICRFSYHYGGFSVPISMLDRCHTLIPDILYGVDHFRWYSQIEEKLPLVIMRFRDIDGRDHATVLGARHLREGSAKAVELVYKTFYNGQGMLQILPKLEFQSGLQDPYYLALWLFQSILGDSDHQNFEEFIVLCDLALMCDDWVTNQSEIENMPGEMRKAAKKALEERDIGPGYIFMHLLNALASSTSTIQPLKVGYTKGKVLDFAHEILKMAGSKCNLVQLTAAAMHYADIVFSPNRRHLPYPKELSRFLKEAFHRTLTFRAEILKGGSFIEDVLCSESAMDYAYRAILPAFSIDQSIVSPVLLWDTPVGPHLLTLSQMQYITDNMICGDTVLCPLRKGDPSPCSLEEVASCTHLTTKRELLNPKYCINQQTQELVMEICGVKELVLHSS